MLGMQQTMWVPPDPLSCWHTVPQPQSLLPPHSCTTCQRTALGPWSPLFWKCLGGPALPSRWVSTPLSGSLLGPSHYVPLS